ncbi:MAG: acyl-CoA dehydrogenase [Acinetobacter sp.]|jgi:alkylation response protein AidB-like acyl-CoA dehydrogenase|nr:MAG: acyl-CoA dehydrogenase [Acinetobacter sp.]
MSDMMNKAQGYGLALLTKLASSDVLDQLNIRKLVERSLYHGSKTGFSTLSKTQKAFKSSNPQPKQRLNPQNKNLFDLGLNEEQAMLHEALQSFASEVIYPLAAHADHDAKFPPELFEQVQELALNFYALPEQYGGVAAEQSVVSNVLIAEDLARGDYALTAGLLSTFSVINAITRWGSQEMQSRYLAAFAEDADIQASIASQENTPAFNPLKLKTKAEKLDHGYQITGEKTLVVLGEQADILLVTAEYNGKPDVFIIEWDDSIAVKSTPAMGLKATETATLRFMQTPARRLGDDDFNYSEFLDYGHLMWCAMAVGTCEAVKAYCINYANERTAFGEPISHRQSVAFMIADMAIEIDAMRMLVWNAASLAEAGKPFHREAYLARLLCAEKSMKIGTDGVQILGGHGFTKEHPVERWYRDLRATAIMQSGLHA